MQVTMKPRFRLAVANTLDRVGKTNFIHTITTSLLSYTILTQLELSTSLNGKVFNNLGYNIYCGRAIVY